MSGPDNQMGSSFSFSLMVIAAIIFCMPFAVIASMDYYQIGNAKDSVDKEVKRAISICMINLMEDNMSANRKIVIDEETLKRDIKQLAESNIQSKYGFDFTIDEMEMILDEKYYVTYKGHIIYAPQIFQGEEDFTITVTGRSKAQRFDKSA